MAIKCILSLCYIYSANIVTVSNNKLVLHHEIFTKQLFKLQNDINSGFALALTCT